MDDPEVNLYATGADNDPAYIPSPEEESVSMRQMIVQLGRN